jgi:lipopolysaccharide export system permease protein
MNIIDRYVGRQLLITSAFAVAVLSVVLVLGRVLKDLLYLLVKSDVPNELILSLVAHIMALSLTFTIPWGFLTAVLLVFGKMSAENELIALRSNGVSISRICLPVALIALLFSGICLWINVEVAPRAEKRMKEAVFNIATSNPLAMFSSDKIIEEFPGRKIYVERNEGRELFNLMVYELNDLLKPMRVVFARRGTLETDLANKRVLMHLYDARLEQREAEAPDDLMKIQQGIIMQETVFPISLQELYEKNKKKVGVGAMTLNQLRENWREGPPTSALKTEVSKRFSFSLASLAFALIAVPLSITAHRKETSVGFAFSLAIAFAYFFIIIMVNTIRDRPELHPEWLIWSPNALFLGLGGWMFYRLSRR